MKKYTYKTRKPKQTISCSNCGKEFLRHIYRIKKENFCSNGCSAQYRYRNSSKLVSCYWCGMPIKIHNYRKAKKHFCSTKCKGKWTSANIFAEKSYNWKGGNYSTIANILCNSRYRRIRKSVIILDNGKCQLCGSIKKLEVHHIIEKGKNPTLIYDVTNMITLCKRCHCRIRGKEDIFVGFFSDLVEKRVKTGNSGTDNPVPSYLITNRQIEGVETRVEETIIPISALPERDDIVQSL